MWVADEIQKLARLRDRGVISDAEFQVQKARVLAHTASTEVSKPPFEPTPRSAPATESRRSSIRTIVLVSLALVASAAVATGVVLAIRPNSTSRVVATFFPAVTTYSTRALGVDAQRVTIRLRELGFKKASTEVRGGSITVLSPTKLSLAASRVATTWGSLQVRPVLCLAGPYSPPSAAAEPLTLPNSCSSVHYELSASNLGVNTNTGLPTNRVPMDPALSAYHSSTTAYNNRNADSLVLLPSTRHSGEPGLRFLLGGAGISNDAFESARAVFNDPDWVLDVTLTGTGATEWDDLAREQFHAYVAFDFDGHVISWPLVLPTQPAFVSFGGRIQISGAFTRVSARNLAIVIGSGPLAVPLNSIEGTH